MIIVQINVEWLFIYNFQHVVTVEYWIWTIIAVCFFCRAGKWLHERVSSARVGMLKGRRFILIINSLNRVFYRNFVIIFSLRFLLFLLSTSFFCLLDHIIRLSLIIFIKCGKITQVNSISIWVQLLTLLISRNTVSNFWSYLALYFFEFLLIVLEEANEAVVQSS